MENKKIKEELNKFNLLFKYNPAVTLEENISSIKKDAINESDNDNKNILNEGPLTDFLRSAFGTTFKSTVGTAAETLLTKALQDIIKSGKQFSINLLRNTAEFKDALKNTVAEACRVKYGKTFNELVAFDKNAAQKLVNEVQGGIEAEMKAQAKSGVKNIQKDVRQAQKNLDKVKLNPKSTAKDIKEFTKELKINKKLEEKWLKAEISLKNMPPANFNKIKKLLQEEVKVKPGPPVGGATVRTKSGIFTMTREQISKLPGKVKTLVVNNKVKSALIAAGGIAALWYFWPATDDTSVALVDTNGNPLTDTPTTPNTNSSGGTSSGGASSGGASSGGASSGGRPSKFTDSDKFPYVFGQRSPIVKEVQICFGFPKKWQTGNFGPHTLEFLNNLYGVSEINENTYNLIKERCKPASTTTNTGTTTNTNTTTNTSTQPTTTQPTTSSISDKVKQEIRSNLKKRQGVLGVGEAYVYKGRDLTPDEQNYLIAFAKERGYEKFIPKEKMGPNDKYVFKKLRK